jgi:DNA modification methylase
LKQWLNQTHIGDCRDVLRKMKRAKVRVQTCVTSPPYWLLRDYGHADQIGLEPTLGEYLEHLVRVFRLVKDILADDGTLWLNMGDAYASDGGSGWQGRTIQRANRRKVAVPARRRTACHGLKPKDLMGQPWRLALALQDDDWYLRSCIIWHKNNPMPESTLDRPTTTHEYIFLLAKQEKYYYDRESTQERCSEETHLRVSQDVAAQPRSERANGTGVNPKAKQVAGWARGEGSHSVLDHARQGTEKDENAVLLSLKDAERARHGHKTGAKFGHGPGWRQKQNASFAAATAGPAVFYRNLRSVWKFPTKGFKDAHFATFPPELPRRCILMGSRPGDTVLDPFMGSGTVAQVATMLGRNFIGVECNPEYVKFQKQRLQTVSIGLGL